ncbi:hypothetical protein TIFTF001_010962 [Ficus carica]|uniref:Tetratricopeptide repeat protein 38 n=1 Tax=Ficus carica TaxID=3494 RepID=A0AA88A9K0_FICCA|nr:hypothetical protein TIFTF001_010962 [Ficus carica]
MAETESDLTLIGAWPSPFVLRARIALNVKNLQYLLKDFPRDLASVKRAQVICFYMGRPDLSLNLIQQVQPQNQEQSYVYGMLAFPLLELGRMEEAEKAAKKALEINKQDSWAQHNLKWNPSLCYLEGHSPIQNILEVYDQRIWKELEKTDAAHPEVYLNSLGLLLRLYVRGEIDVFEDRLKILTSCITDQRNWFLELHLDVLILWALAHAGEFSKAEDLLKGLKSRVAKMNNKKQQLMQKGLSLSEAMYEYGRGNEEQALELLGPDFDAKSYKIIGASDEQLDVFIEVWYSMLLNTGQATKAIEALEKSIKKREGVPFLWRLLERAYSMIGSKEATIAGEKAKVLESKYFK